MPATRARHPSRLCPSRDEGVTKPAPLVSSVLRAIECMLFISSTLRRASWRSRSESKNFVTDFHCCKNTGCRKKKSIQNYDVQVCYGRIAWMTKTQTDSLPH